MAISDELKRQREEAVSGLKGTRHITVFLLCIYQSFSGYLHDSIISFIVYCAGTNQLDENFLLVIDFLSIVLPNILVCAFVDYILEITIGTFILSVLLRLIARKSIGIFSPWNNNYLPYKVIKYNTTTKVSVKFMSQANSILLIGIFYKIIATSISILFVDFLAIYPRCLVKTEDYGISLMDVGTGAILCTSGISYALFERNY